jgi:hypothetical protein
MNIKRVTYPINNQNKAGIVNHLFRKRDSALTLFSELWGKLSNNDNSQESRKISVAYLDE